MDTLTPEQKAAYNKTLGTPLDSKAGEKNWTGCQDEADKKVYGSASAQERSTTTAHENQANAQALNGDPKLVALAQSYVSEEGRHLRHGHAADRHRGDGQTPGTRLRSGRRRRDSRRRRGRKHS